MACTTFTQYTDSKTLARDSHAVLSEQRRVFISADSKRDCIAFSMGDDAHSSQMFFTAEQARAIATELLACANAHDALRSVEPSLKG